MHYVAKIRFSVFSLSVSCCSLQQSMTLLRRSTVLSCRHLHKHLVTVDILSHNDASWIPSELKKKKKGGRKVELTGELICKNLTSYDQQSSYVWYSRKQQNNKYNQLRNMSVWQVNILHRWAHNSIPIFKMCYDWTKRCSKRTEPIINLNSKAGTFVFQAVLQVYILPYQQPKVTSTAYTYTALTTCAHAWSKQQIPSSFFPTPLLTLTSMAFQLNNIMHIKKPLFCSLNDIRAYNAYLTHNIKHVVTYKTVWNEHHNMKCYIKPSNFSCHSKQLQKLWLKISSQRLQPDVLNQLLSQLYVLLL